MKTIALFGKTLAPENGDIADWRYVNYIRMMTDESHDSVKEEGI